MAFDPSRLKPIEKKPAATGGGFDPSRLKPLNPPSSSGAFLSTPEPEKTGIMDKVAAVSNFGESYIVRPGSELLKGFVKGTGKTSFGMLSLVDRAMGQSQEDIQAKKTKFEEAVTTPTNNLQKVGMGVEQFAELLVPVGGAVGITGKAATMAPKATQYASALSKFGVSASVAEKAGRFLEGAAKVGGRAIGEGVDVGAKRLVQTQSPEQALDEAKTAALLSSAFQIGGKVLNEAGDSTRKWLERQNLKLTVSQGSNLQKRIDDATTYLADNPIIGSGQSRLTKINQRVGGYEKVLAESLEGSAGKVNKQAFLDGLEKLKDGFKGERDYLAATRQVDDIIENVKAAYGDDVSELTLAQINKFKRSLWDNAYNEAGVKVIDEIEHEAGEVAKKLLDDAADQAGVLVDGKPMREFLKEYGRVLNARKFIKAASGRSEVGLAAKLMLGAAGFAAGGPAGLMAGSAVQATGAMTRTRSAIVAALRSVDDKIGDDAIAAIIRGIIAGTAEEPPKP